MLEVNVSRSEWRADIDRRVCPESELARREIGSDATASTVARKKLKLMIIFGTTPEIIKLAPVVQALERSAERFETVVVNTGQPFDSLQAFLDRFGVHVTHDLDVLQPAQSANGVCSRVLASLDRVLATAKPDLVLVQGDTTSSLAGALAAFHHQIPVGHIEAGLRTGDRSSPYPEEMNRRLITRLASFHFAPTEQNRDALLAEGVPAETIVVTGNPVVDSLLSIRRDMSVSHVLQHVLDRSEGYRRIILTMRRRENIGEVMSGYLRVIGDFVRRHDDVALIFPMHPIVEVRNLVEAQLTAHPRIQLLEPLGYADFIGLLSRAWLVLSDSGGVQEEAPTLGKPLLILRQNTERPEVLRSGVAPGGKGRPAPGVDARTFVPGQKLGSTCGAS